MNRKYNKVRELRFGVISSYIIPLTYVIQEELEPENTSRYSGVIFLMFSMRRLRYRERSSTDMQRVASIEGFKRG